MRPFTLRYGETIVHVGEGALGRLGAHLKVHRRLLLVTGSRSARESGALDDATKMLEDLGISWNVYDGVFPNPTDRIVDEIA
ncbi:MAG: iron-containing alcohol dehydrogenase, partial [Conexivisphaera sp.]